MKYKIEMNEEFNCPRTTQEAFDYIVDFGNIHEWDHTVLSSQKLGSGPVELGSKFDLVLAMGKRKVPLAYEITEYNSPTRAVLSGVSKNFTAVDTVTLTKTSDGCHVTWNAKLEFHGLSALLVRMMKKKIMVSGAQTIRDLEKILSISN